MTDEPTGNAASLTSYPTGIMASSTAVNESVTNPAGAESHANVPLPSESSWVELCAAALVFLSALAYLCLFRRYTTMEPDEGIVLQGAQRILRGDVLYRDFFSFYTPGSYYLLAAIFRVFGSSIIVARTTLALVGACTSLLSYLLVRRRCSRAVALVTVALLTLTALPFRFLVLHNWDSTLWACVAFYCAVRLTESRGAAWAFATGTFACFTVLFEQSKGVGLILGLGAGLLAIHLTRSRRTAPDRQAWPNRSRWTALAGGFAWPLCTTFAYFGFQHALRIMLEDWVWPLRHYSTANRVPFGYQNWSDATRTLLFDTGSWIKRLFALLTLSPCFLIPALPLIGAGLGIYWFVRRAKRDKAEAAFGEHGTAIAETAGIAAPIPESMEAKSAYYLLTSATLSGLLLSVALTRADILHFMYLAPLFILVLAWLLDGRDIPGTLFRSLRPYFRAYVVISFLLLSIPLLTRVTAASNRESTVRGVITSPAPDSVIPYVQSHVAPGEKIVVYPYLPLFYYLTGTYSAVRFDYLQPGMHTSRQSEEMIAEMAATLPRAVLLEISFNEKIAASWPGTPLPSIAADPVNEYILRHYRSCRTLQSPANWRFLFMVRNDLPCLEP